jgi:hypothetical protein
MATADVNAPAVGRHGEPCATCGAPLAGDQRYCLACGARRARARVAFRDILAAGPAPATGHVAVEEPDPAAPRSGAAFLAGLACLLLALGVGVLIGRSGNGGGTVATTPPPQVISVGGAAPAAPAATTTTGPATTSTDGTSTTPKAHEPASKGGSKATNPALKKLDSTSGKTFEKRSGKLPKTVSTGGKPPPKDKKPAGGGTGFQNIG